MATDGRRPFSLGTRARQSSRTSNSGLIERDLRLPAGEGGKLAAVPEQGRHVDRAQQLGIDDRADRVGGQRNELFEDFGYRRRHARRDVVDLARLAVLHQQSVGAHDVAHVGEVPAGERSPTRTSRSWPRSASTIRLASAETTKASAWPGPTWLKGRARITSSPRPSWACRPRYSACHLAGRAWGDRTERSLLGERCSTGRSVDLGRADQQNPRRRTEAARHFE